ncbi:MAG TPA: patatin-like phospholipase family protein [Candidatus Angelobacter sp.]|nr:patatin-like phospholipase family protein [Candidatus Angelobacter sp.]
MSDTNLHLPTVDSTGAPLMPQNTGPFTFDDVRKKEDEALGGGDVQRSALCISGGGIRSATFALGALQGLAELGILEHFDYLSTVSGGGYIGGWLTAWKERAGGINKVIPELKSSACPVPPGKLDPIQHLREYNSFLSPKLGFFSADTWALVATIARNMFLNWLVFIPLLMCALTLPRIVLSLARLGDTCASWYPFLSQFFSSLEHVVPVIGGIFFAVGVFFVLYYLPGAGHKNHTEGQFLVYCFTPLFLAALGLVVTDAWFTGGTKDTETTLNFGGLFLWVTGFGLLGYLAFFCWRPVKTRLDRRRDKNAVHQWPKLKWKGLLAAGVCTSFCTAGGAWLLASEWFRHLSWPVYVTFALPLLFLSFGVAVAGFVGFTSRVLGDDDREWLARAGAWALLTILSWAGFSALTLLGPKLIFQLHAWADSALAAAGGLSGLVATLAGLSSKTRAQADKNGESANKSTGLLDLAGKLAAPVFIVVFLSSLALLTNWILWKTRAVGGDWKDHKELLEQTRTEYVVLLALVFVAFSWVMAKFIDINKFSLQAMYRNRIIRAYLGASNAKPDLNDFTGFASNDNPLLSRLTPALKPFHILNMTLNMASGKRLAWQQRKARSFTVSPLHCGFGETYRPVVGYGGKGGLSLGTAMAISGAAASPNMGYHSSPALAFIMTLFNARLGAWLGNPGQPEWTHEGPKSAFNSIVREAFGGTKDDSPYVYLSDGEHFENLALYEMVRRRCRYIMVLDGGADPNYMYGDLGNAVRKIRIDMKVPITFEQPFLMPLSDPKYRCAIAKIGYKSLCNTLENGYLIYIKPSILGSEPADVTNYKSTNPAFPHQSTANQFFNESQTESYRMLGVCSIQQVFKHWEHTDGFEAVVQNARDHLRPQPPAATAAAGGK